ncbi:hypothetical protein F2Q69_00006209 [Brassica cretica]|uniref:Uncharacterized protein n=1 Tax=Brassica cretica TaxID=69181 RepID=A0A8S9P267_BRACR|nr:hypothetical protein F2Q69_00006209 [Brassica cretica]
MFLEFEFTFSFSRLLKPDHQGNEPRAGQERELNTSWPGRERLRLHTRSADPRTGAVAIGIASGSDANGALAVWNASCPG